MEPCTKDASSRFYEEHAELRRTVEPKQCDPRCTMQAGEHIGSMS
ncbi:Hypothetical protein A7982_02924 [Minicystis rosea]|nr:Hypothetical protein A7982_02924 [Minicystis rosea]